MRVFLCHHWLHLWLQLPHLRMFQKGIIIMLKDVLLKTSPNGLEFSFQGNTPFIKVTCCFSCLILIVKSCIVCLFICDILCSISLSTQRLTYLEPMYNHLYYVHKIWSFAFAVMQCFTGKGGQKPQRDSAVSEEQGMMILSMMLYTGLYILMCIKPILEIIKMIY